MRVEDLTKFEGECPNIVVFGTYMDIRVPLTKKWKKIINERGDKPNTYHNCLISYISEQIALSGFNMKSIGNLLIKGIVFNQSKILLENNNCPLTGVCYDQDILDPIIRYYKTWNSYPEDFSWPDLMRQCYDNFFKSWHEEYEYWADDESALREELHNNQYEDRLYYKNGDVYVGQLNEIA